jgi:arylsulfatase
VSDRPNIILVITDQQRADTIGAWGYDHMVTPAMDELAREGYSFRNAFCPGATCMASRAAIFTGMYPHNTGVYSFNDWSGHRLWTHDLKEAGYWCASVGKMHLNSNDVDDGFHERIITENPTGFGRENGGADDDWGRYLAHHGQVRPNHRNRTDPEWLSKFQGVPWHLEECYHSDVFIGDAAVGWVETYNSDRPLFLEVGFTGPHEPWDPLPRHLEMYQDAEIPPAVFRDGELDDNPPEHTSHRRWFEETSNEAQIRLRDATPDQIAGMRRHYYGNITTVDEKLGQLMAALERKGLLENSIVLFCSDHGEMLGDHGLVYKWLMYDCITRIPLIIRDYREEGKVGSTDDLVSLMDLGPTILEAAGIETPGYLEGRSLSPYFQGHHDEVRPREFVFCEDNYEVMMRGRDHKIVYYIGQEYGELYDLRQDPHELHNLWSSESHEALRTQLQLLLLQWLAQSNYWTAGYKQKRLRKYGMNWPHDGRAALSHNQLDASERPVDL